MNEIHILDSPLNEDPSPKYNFFQGGPNFWGFTVEKFKENGL